jgi:hypothetical protein
MPRSAAPTWCYGRDAVALLGAPAPRHPGHAPAIAMQPREARLRPAGAHGVDLCDVATESCRGLRRARARRMAGPPPSGGRASSAAVFAAGRGAVNPYCRAGAALQATKERALYVTCAVLCLFVALRACAPPYRRSAAANDEGVRAVHHAGLADGRGRKT